MVARMKLLMAALLCLPTVLSRPAEVSETEAVEMEAVETEAVETEAVEAVEMEAVEAEEAETTEEPEEERFPRSFSHRLVPTFYARGVRDPLVTLSPGNEIPRSALSIFSPPIFATKEERERAFFGNTRFEAPPPHAHLVVQNELFFDTFDHAQVILGYEKRRKMDRLPLHLLKSLRPYFPFFVLD